MSIHENLYGKEGIEKLKQLAESADMCMFATQLDSVPITARPMSTRKVDENGSIWFFSRINSNKNKEIALDNRVQIFYSNSSSIEFMNVYGQAEIIIDKQIARELWSVWAKSWFPDGVDDPELTLIKVTPVEVKYWDTQHHKMVSMVKMVGALISGKEMDDGVEGKIRVKSL